MMSFYLVYVCMLLLYVVRLHSVYFLHASLCLLHALLLHAPTLLSIVEVSFSVLRTLSFVGWLAVASSD